MIPERGWKWVWTWRCVGVWLARSSDGLWTNRGKPVGRFYAAHDRLESGCHVFRLSIGEYAGAVLIDPNKFRKAHAKPSPASNQSQI